MVGISGRPGLVLWDIDHTLINTGGLGRHLYHRAFQAVTGRAVTEEVVVTGRTEQAIFTETARRHDIEPTQALAEDYRHELGRQYEEHVDELRRRGWMIRGASAALAALIARPELVQSVLTGNFRAVARVKLRTFELDSFLDLEVGAYGEDAPDRADLVPLAQARATGRHGGVFDRSSTVLIGDSAADVAAGRGLAAVVAVATGRTSRGELEAAGPEAVLDDLAGVDLAVARVFACRDEG